jgi:hypothetical protein
VVCKYELTCAIAIPTCAFAIPTCAYPVGMAKKERSMPERINPISHTAATLKQRYGAPSSSGHREHQCSLASCA